MSAQVPESSLTTDELLKLALFNRMLADDLDVAIGAGGGGSGSSPTLDLTSSEVALVSAGTPVYLSSAAHFLKASAGAASTGRVIGLPSEDAIPGIEGPVRTAGTLTLTTAQWDAICGTTGGLAFNVPYYLDATTPGKLTATPPNVNGQVIQQVIVGVSPTVAVIKISDPEVVGSGSTVVYLTNDNAGAALIGMPIYSSSAEGFNFAIGNNTGKSKVIGLVADATIAPGARGKIVTSDLIIATTAQWDVICGTVGGLTYNTSYYLSISTAGRLTATAPSSPTDDGKEVALVLIALSPTEARIVIQPSILL